MADESHALALEEWKHCESIIARLENSINQRQAWFFALITALVVLLLQKDPLLSGWQFLCLGLAVVVVFLVTDVIQRVPVGRAIRRASAIESALRSGEEYQGSLLSQSLSEGSFWTDMLISACRLRVLWPYVAMAGVVVILSIPSCVLRDGGRSATALVPTVHPRWPDTRMFDQNAWGRSGPGASLVQEHGDSNVRIQLHSFLYDQKVATIGEIGLVWIGSYEDTDYYIVASVNGFPGCQSGQIIEYDGGEKVLLESDTHRVWLANGRVEARRVEPGG